MRALRQEVCLLRGTAKGLELQLQETMGSPALAEENDALRVELEELKQEDGTLRATVRELRQDRDLLRGYRVKVLEEHKAGYEARLRELECQRGLLRPLLQSLVSVAEGNRAAVPAAAAATRCAHQIGVALHDDMAVPCCP